MAFAPQPRVCLCYRGLALKISMGGKRFPRISQNSPGLTVIISLSHVLMLFEPLMVIVMTSVFGTCRAFCMVAKAWVGGANVDPIRWTLPPHTCLKNDVMRSSLVLTQVYMLWNIGFVGFTAVFPNIYYLLMTYVCIFLLWTFYLFILDVRFCCLWLSDGSIGIDLVNILTCSSPSRLRRFGSVVPLHPICIYQVILKRRTLATLLTVDSKR